MTQKPTAEQLRFEALHNEWTDLYIGADKTAQQALAVLNSNVDLECMAKAKLLYQMAVQECEEIADEIIKNFMGELPMNYI